MEKLIDFEAYPVRMTLPILLQDKTTKKNIIWATDTYADKGIGFQDTDRNVNRNLRKLRPGKKCRL